MYASMNFRTKKALKDYLALGGKVRIYQPGGLINPPEADPHYTGKAYLEGPHYPESHTWYAEAAMEDGFVVKVK